MINIVLYEPEIPENTGNIMRTCAATNSRLHLIEPFGFIFDEKRIKRSGANYIDKVDYERYVDFDDFFILLEMELVLIMKLIFLIVVKIFI